MKSYIALLFLCSGLVTSVLPASLDKKPVESSSDSRNDPEDLLPEKEPVAPEDVFKFFLYTESVDSSIEMNINSSRKTVSYNENIPTKILVHGFTGDEKTESIESMKSSYLEKGNFNVIGFDWSPEATWTWPWGGRDNGTAEVEIPEDIEGAADYAFWAIIGLFGGKTYHTAVENTFHAGKYLALFIDNLVSSFGVKLKDVHLIGFSLGGHVVGVAGAHVSHGKVGRITGLDPADPLFTDAADDKRLDKSDATFVDCIHTDTVGLVGKHWVIEWIESALGYIIPLHFGIRKPCGHVDFYPNGGNKMLDCPFDQITCSHMSAPKYFAKSIKSPHAYPGYKCRSLEEEIKNTYNNGPECKKCCDKCPEKGVYMGEAATPHNTGLYYAYTVDKYKPTCDEAKAGSKRASGNDAGALVTSSLIKIFVIVNTVVQIISSRMSL